ncbi:MAG: ComF family protein [Eubacterium sp.]|nr:ComF family protein [Eubacterium sp.]
MDVKMALRDTLRRVMFVPGGACPVCGRVLFRTPEHLCARCQGDLPKMNQRACRCCGRPLASEQGLLCGHCASEVVQVFSGGFVWLHYRAGAQRMIAALKFGGRPVLGLWMGAQMAGEIAALDWCEAVEAVLPVPLHPHRFLERGYNQSAFLARGIGNALNLPVLEDALVRYADTPHQLGLSRSARMKNLTGAFAVKDEAAVEGKTLLLTDDVITTGSTLRECAATLLAAGARAVYVCAAAAAPGD